MDTKEQQHAKLSPSKSSAWLACPGSVINDNPEIEEIQGEAAKIGTAIHGLSEWCLVTDLDPYDSVDKIVEDVEITEDYAAIAEDYINYFNDLIDEVKLANGKNIKYGFEQQIKFTVEIYGTMDGFIYDLANKMLHIIDLKAGRVEVSAQGNTQLMIYALGFIKSNPQLNFKGFTIKLHIVQPAIYNFDTYTISLADLIAIGAMIKDKAKLAMIDNPERNAGEKQCKWCQNNATCSTLKTYMDNLIGEEFDNLMTNINNNKTPLEDLVNIVKNKNLIMQYLNNIEGYLLTVASSGLEDLKPYGFKLVESRTQRKFNDDAEDVLYEELGDEIYKPKKLKGIGDITKLLGKARANVLEDIVYKPAGKMQLAELSDKREEIELF